MLEVGEVAPFALGRPPLHTWAKSFQTLLLPLKIYLELVSLNLLYLSTRDTTFHYDIELKSFRASAFLMMTSSFNQLEFSYRSFYIGNG